MKKYVIAVLVLTLSALLLASCGKSDAVKQVEALIKQIDSQVGLDDEESILAAQKAYDGLSDEEKEKVGNYKKLESAAAKFDELTHDEVLERRIMVMDSTAAAMCRDNNIPILVFNLTDPENIFRAVSGEKIGTLVK